MTDTDLSAASTLDAGATVSLGAALGLATGDPVLLAAVAGAIGAAVLRIVVAEATRQILAHLERRRGGQQ